jgi:hypothetical protein
MSLEANIVHLSAMLDALRVEVIGLRAAMQTLTATASVEIESRTGRPTIEVLKFGTDEHADAIEAAGFSAVHASPPCTVKKRRGRPAGIREESARAVCRSSCCGAEHRRMSPDDGRCFACR